jgi:methylase of polypeptide subunit release factors
VRLDAGVVDLLRSALASASYTVDAVIDLLGESAHRALGRNETAPALRRTLGGSPLDTLTRLWPLQVAVDVAAAERALPGLVERLCGAGLLERSVAEVRALVDVRPYADEEHDWWVVADLTPGLDGAPERVAPDHVLGVSSASGSLAALTIREHVGSALDLGAGSGVQSLHLSGHTRVVVASDVNRRALEMAALTAALNDIPIDLRNGSLFTPVSGERFDLIVTNPPFVISPATGERLIYRDSGLPGDEVVRRILVGAAEHLNPGGWCQVLANWAHRAGQSWHDRVTDWIQPTRCDVWAVQREVLDPAEYVELWLADAGLRHHPDYLRRYDTWLAWFEREGIEAVGMGWVNLHDTDGTEPVHRLEEWPHEIELPIGPHVAAWGRRTSWLRANTDLTGTHLLAAEGVVQEAVGPPGASDPERIILRQQCGVRRATQVDTVEAALVGACDGDLSVGQILDALARLLDRAASDLRRDYLPRIRRLVDEGFLTPDC